MTINKHEEYIKIDRIEEILLQELNLLNILSEQELVEFYQAFIPYIKHGRKEDYIGGRTPETIEKNLENYIDFCKLIGLTDREITESIKNFPAIIREDLTNKYILLGLIENETNTLRKENLINRPEDFIIDIKVIYARLMLMHQLKYPANWSNVVKNTQKEFASIFTKSKYSKPHKIFESIEDVTSDKLKQNYPYDENYIEYLRNLEVNEEFRKSGKSL